MGVKYLALESRGVLLAVESLKYSQYTKVYKLVEKLSALGKGRGVYRVF